MCARPQSLEEMVDHSLGRVLDLFGIDSEPGEALGPGGAGAASEKISTTRTLATFDYPLGRRSRRRLCSSISTGTLIEIAPTPESVVVPPDLVAAATKLAPARCGGALAIISAGRSRGARTIGAKHGLPMAPASMAASCAQSPAARSRRSARTLRATCRRSPGRSSMTLKTRWPGVRGEDKGPACSHYSPGGGGRPCAPALGPIGPRR